MTRPSPAEARIRIADIIGRSVILAIDLKDSLKVEQRALEQQDSDALHEILIGKNACAEGLQALELERSVLCEAWGFPAGPNQMDDCLVWCDQDSVISNDWQHLLGIAAEGRSLNLTNGAIIRLRQQHFESSISVLRGVAPGSDTYGRSGEESGEFSRRSLAEA